MTKEEWFRSWFNSKYYHILYKQRDDGEAKYFLDNLMLYLKPPENSSFLDVACGQGRHAIYLNSLGHHVTGIDLSPRNIEHANSYGNETLKFYVHDMRDPFGSIKYDYVLNLFTSFGYFDSDKEHVDTIRSMFTDLTNDGTLVLDYFNSELVKKNLRPSETKSIDDIEFSITRKIENEHIVKSIEFYDEGIGYSYFERVRLLGVKDFRNYFEKVGLVVKDIFGNYELDEFDLDDSDRLIFILKK